ASALEALGDREGALQALRSLADYCLEKRKPEARATALSTRPRWLPTIARSPPERLTRGWPGRPTAAPPWAHPARSPSKAARPNARAISGGVWRTPTLRQAPSPKRA